MSQSYNRSSEQSACPPWTGYVFSVVYGLLFLTGLLLNGLTLRVFLRRRGGGGGGNAGSSRCVGIYLKNLAAADFLLTLCLPFRVVKHAAGLSPLLLRAYCGLGAPAFYLNMYASILFMGHIAGNRYLKIVHPLRTHPLQSPRVARAVCAVTWLLLLTLAGTYVVLSLLTDQAATAESRGCDDLQSEQSKALYKAFHVFWAAVFLTVLTGVLFFYGGTSRRLATARRRRPSSSGWRRLSESRRNAQVLAAVFCVCFVPYHLARLPYAVLRPAHCSAWFYLKEAGVAVSVLNVCLDPLLYFTFCKAFRERRRRDHRPASARPAVAEPTFRKTSACSSTSDFT
ncbi:P2Y purinoceptor 14-like isoform X2 [Stigmatopora nigra]